MGIYQEYDKKEKGMVNYYLALGKKALAKKLEEYKRKKTLLKRVETQAYEKEMVRLKKIRGKQKARQKMGFSKKGKTQKIMEPENSNRLKLY